MTIEKYPKSQTGLKAEKANVHTGEGTTVIANPFDAEKTLTAPGHNARTVKDLQAGSDKLSKGMFTRK